MSSNFGKSYPFYILLLYCYQSRPHLAAKGHKWNHYKLYHWFDKDIKVCNIRYHLKIPKFPEFHAFSKIAPGIEHLAFWTWLKCETQGLQLLWDRQFLKLGVWQRHTGLKNWRLAAAPFAIQLLSKLPCQLWDKQKLDSRLHMPQNRQERQVRQRQRDVDIH